MPDGCFLKDNEITCHSSQHEVRGELLANFQLFGLVLGVVAATAGAYFVVDTMFGCSTQLSSGDQDEG